MNREIDNGNKLYELLKINLTTLNDEDKLFRKINPGVNYDTIKSLDYNNKYIKLAIQFEKIHNLDKNFFNNRYIQKIYSLGSRYIDEEVELFDDEESLMKEYISFVQTELENKELDEIEHIDNLTQLPKILYEYENRIINKCASAKDKLTIDINGLYFYFRTTYDGEKQDPELLKYFKDNKSTVMNYLMVKYYNVYEMMAKDMNYCETFRKTLKMYKYLHIRIILEALGFNIDDRRLTKIIPSTQVMLLIPYLIENFKDLKFEFGLESDTILTKQKYPNVKSVVNGMLRWINMKIENDEGVRGNDNLRTHTYNVYLVARNAKLDLLLPLLYIKSD